MALRHMLDREINRARGVDFDVRQASLALKNDRYAISLAVLHKLMIRYLNELRLDVIGNHFEEKILELKREKSKRISQNFSIYKAVLQFFDEAKVLAKRTPYLIQLFQGLLVKFMREMDLTDDIQRLNFKMEKTDHTNIRAIDDLINYICPVVFEEEEDPLGGEVENFERLNGQKERVVFGNMITRGTEEHEFFEELQKKEKDERKTYLKRKKEKRLEQGQSSKRGRGARR